MDNISDEENDLQTSDYFSENTPKSCKSVRLDHKYVNLFFMIQMIYILNLILIVSHFHRLIL